MTDDIRIANEIIDLFRTFNANKLEPSQFKERYRKIENEQQNILDDELNKIIDDFYPFIEEFTEDESFHLEELRDGYISYNLKDLRAAVEVTEKKISEWLEKYLKENKVSFN